MPISYPILSSGCNTQISPRSSWLETTVYVRNLQHAQGTPLVLVGAAKAHSAAYTGGTPCNWRRTKSAFRSIHRGHPLQVAAHQKRTLQHTQGTRLAMGGAPKVVLYAAILGQERKVQSTLRRGASPDSEKVVQHDRCVTNVNGQCDGPVAPATHHLPFVEDQFCWRLCQSNSGNGHTLGVCDGHLQQNRSPLSRELLAVLLPISGDTKLSLN